LCLHKIYALLLLLSVSAWPALAASKADPKLASLNTNARQEFLTVMDLGDRCWDPQSKLIAFVPHGQLEVRESSSYALGLLLRNGKGDDSRAIDILNAVLAQQYHAPDKPFDGTFHRNLVEAYPPVNAVIWRDYDPNWREFIGTTFAMILEEYPNRIPRELADRMLDSIDLAVSGEIKNHRLVPTYTNPALMYGFLWNFAAVRSHRADWIAQSTEWQETVYKLFEKHDAFNEYNSPTYCGVDLYALGLWRRYGSTAHMRAMGSEMEATLWRDEAEFYNANLRNLSGPFDRAYGMDMESYVSVIGLAMRTVLDARTAPLPGLDPPLEHLDHSNDLWFSPHLVILGTCIPEDALAKIKRFAGEHLVRRQITDQRIATAWIGKSVIYGGEATAQTMDVGAEAQFHPATVQWRTPSGEIGWIQLVQSPMIDAKADEHGLTISTTGTIRLRIHAKGLSQGKISATDWELPGLSVAVTSDVRNFSLEKAEKAVDLVYSGITSVRLEIIASQ